MSLSNYLILRMNIKSMCVFCNCFWGGPRTPRIINVTQPCMYIHSTEYAVPSTLYQVSSTKYGVQSGTLNALNAMLYEMYIPACTLCLSLRCPHFTPLCPYSLVPVCPVLRSFNLLFLYATSFLPRCHHIPACSTRIVRPLLFLYIQIQHNCQGHGQGVQSQRIVQK